ncbi:MAG: biotin/lipoyl-binding protein, partial [bacterium]
ISGILKDVFINEGDYVNPGELLGIIDDEDMKANLLKIEKELEISKNNLTAAEQELKLLKLSNENSLREAEINLKQAQAELENQIKIQEASKTIYAQTAKELNLPSPKEEPYELRNKKMVYCTIN